MTVSTHILDAVAGHPAAGVSVALSSVALSSAALSSAALSSVALSSAALSSAALSSADSVDSWLLVESAATDADGRHRFAAATPPGVYRLVFATAPYFAARSIAAFYPEVTITFSVSGEPGTHFHVPLLLSPYAYSTYRGS
jgi:5-hydroxyisourate hydrolase